MNYSDFRHEKIQTWEHDMINYSCPQNVFLGILNYIIIIYKHINIPTF